MHTTASLPVTLLTGFLGSGKTTLLNRLLREAPLTAVVMNEFGAVALDHQLLEQTRGPLALLSGGCVCCEVQGALAPTLKNLWMAREGGQVPRFERVVIETTGIADPGPVLASLAGERWLAARYRLDGIVTTVDAQFGLDQLAAHFEAQRQVAMADRLLVTKTDLAAPAQVEALHARLRALNPAAPVLTVLHGAIEPAQLFGLRAHRPDGEPQRAQNWLAYERYRPLRLGPTAPSPAAQSPATQAPHGRIRAFSLRFEQPLDALAVRSALEMLVAFRPRNLLRMKAIVHYVGHERPVVLHGVQDVLYAPVELDAWPDADRSSRFVFIVADLDEALVARLLHDFTAAAGVLQAVASSQRASAGAKL
ncbi:MAG: GTP-binding protein [Thiobacillaceae bacterium]|nr:GTP-binding protein [Thiobacillaceae bacterium]MCX7673231.1 GTP-binding protein [Thiobacillaceae bacterium]MDW8324437.1 GTP-binding protein [Burkholderiales bacterium]